MSTSPERFARIKELLLAAREFPEDGRENFVREQAAADAELAAEVLELLARENSAHSLLDRGVVSPRAEIEMPERIGPYHIEAVLGEGGMGVVYRARQEEPIRRQVALKLIRRGMQHESVVRRFEQESRTLARMDHPHIATVLDAGTDDQGHPWFVMPLVEGLPLIEFCDAEKLGIGDRLRLFEDVCRAVHHAHGRGVLHRDLKPGNILVRRVSGQPVPVIIDFGIAKALQVEDVEAETMLLTREGQTVGTPAYMSPEQIAGDEALIDARSDVYALGVIVYELLAGRHPYSDEHGNINPASTEAPKAPSTAITDHNTDELAARRGLSPRELRRRLKGDIDTICLMAVRAEPDRRYPSAAHLADDLRRLREGHPVDARPDSWSYRTGKFIRRHPAAAALAGAASVAIVAGAIGLGWHANRLEIERDRALAAEAKALRELETSAAIVSFMESLFELARPGQGGTSEIRAIDMLDLGTGRIDEELAGEPWLQAALYRMLGVVNHSLSRNDQADSLLQIALSVNDSISDRDRGEIRYQRGQILVDHGVVQHDRGLYPEAAAIHRDAIRQYEQSGIADSTDIAMALNYLGINLQADGKLAESVAPTERSLKLNEEYGPPGDPEIAWGWGSLGYINFQLGRLDVAIEQFEHAVALARELFDGDHYDLAHHLNNLGGAYHRIGRLEESESLLIENLEMNQRMFETEPHGSLSRAYQNVASLCLDLDQASRALDLLERGYTVSVEALGAEHPRTARHLSVMAIARQRTGDPNGALADARRAAEIMWAALPEGHRDHEGAYFTMGRILVMRGEYEYALPYLERWCQYVEETYPEGHYRRAHACMRLGEARAGLGESRRAAELFTIALAGYTGSFGPDHYRAAECRELLSTTQTEAP